MIYQAFKEHLFVHSLNHHSIALHYMFLPSTIKNYRALISLSL